MPVKSPLRRKAMANLPVAFWDASALVPLCCWQPQTKAARQARRLFPQMVVWWATDVECTSALRRLERAQAFTAPQIQQAIQGLDRLQSRWTEMSPAKEVRDEAKRLLNKHNLRAADALQLAAALAWCNSYPKGKTFVSGDDRLLDAAEQDFPQRPASLVKRRSLWSATTWRRFGNRVVIPRMLGAECHSFPEEFAN